MLGLKSNQDRRNRLPSPLQINLLFLVNPSPTVSKGPLCWTNPFPPPAPSPEPIPSPPHIYSHVPFFWPISVLDFPFRLSFQLLTFLLPSVALTYLLYLIFPNYLPLVQAHPNLYPLYLTAPTHPQFLLIKNLLKHTFGNCCPSSSLPSSAICPPLPDTKYFNPIKSTFPKTERQYSGGKFLQKINIFAVQMNTCYLIVSQLHCLCNLEAILYNSLDLSTQDLLWSNILKSK